MHCCLLYCLFDSFNAFFNSSSFIQLFSSSAPRLSFKSTVRGPKAPRRALKREPKSRRALELKTR